MKALGGATMSLRNPDEINPYSPYLQMTRRIESLHDQGLSNPQIAKNVGLSRQSVWRYRRGKQGLSWKRRQRYRKLEQPLYEPVKRALESDARRMGLNPSLEIRANTRWKKFIPDIRGYVGSEKVVAEIKAARIRPRHIKKAAKYRRYFSANYAFLISSEEIPSDVSAVPGVALAYFDVKKRRLHWSDGNPFLVAGMREMLATEREFSPKAFFACLAEVLTSHREALARFYKTNATARRELLQALKRLRGKNCARLG